MHRPFRSGIVFLLTALLLLRSWAGDAMAIGMLPKVHEPVAAMAMADEHHASAGVTPPCHEMAENTADDMPHEQHGKSHNTDNCGTCISCQICHSTAMTAVAAPAPGFDQPQSAPHAALLSFSSAEPQPGFKPPIS